LTKYILKRLMAFSRDGSVNHELMISFVKKYIERLSELKAQVNFLYEKHGAYDLKHPKFLQGKILSELYHHKNIGSIQEVEFQVFSQFGDDGIIQYLVNKLDIPNKTFVEFGVENYTESNTRFLLINNNWSGLIIDGDKKNIEFVKGDPITAMHDLHAVASFVTKENINQLLKNFLEKGYSEEIGILSIDIDGNDYWIWNEIDVVRPVIVIVEYNSAFGNDKAWTIPYKPDFYRLQESSFQYWGASLKAFELLGQKKGYSLIGSNSAGNNAYFVRNDKLGGLKRFTTKEAYVLSKFREDVDASGERHSIFDRMKLIKGKQLYNIETNQLETV
jgi:hypothetical protein